MHGHEHGRTVTKPRLWVWCSISPQLSICCRLRSWYARGRAVSLSSNDSRRVVLSPWKSYLPKQKDETNDRRGQAYSWTRRDERQARTGVFMDDEREHFAQDANAGAERFGSWVTRVSRTQHVMLGTGCARISVWCADNALCRIGWAGRTPPGAASPARCSAPASERRYGRIAGPAPPVMAHSLLLIALAAAIE